MRARGADARGLLQSRGFAFFFCVERPDVTRFTLDGLYDFRLIAHNGAACNDCVTLEPVAASGWTNRSTRGGSRTASKEELCSTRRFGLPDDYRGTLYTGVRCARDP
jgi:hypothetical protein